MFNQPVTEIIRRRFSCRDYVRKPIQPAHREQLTRFIAAHSNGPFGSPTRFQLTVAQEAHRKALRGLRTYGFIHNAMGFILGAMGEGEKNLEDFGYVMESIILFATDVGLGTCWLGGSFTKSRFAREIEAREEERVPAVTATGYCAGGAEDGSLRRQVGGARRYAWDRLFFEERFGLPLSREAAGAYAEPLEMVRLGPSASNKQPWRIVRDGAVWHFYIQRTPGYRDRWIVKLMNVDDLQRVDAGIAMCHFERTARELGLDGRWIVSEPPIPKPDGMTEYITSWEEE